MKSCVVRAHGAGLWSNINKVVTCLRIYDYVQVDWSKADVNDPAYKYGGSFYGDCWDYLFEPSAWDDRFPTDTILEYPFYEVTGACAGVLYQNEQWNWRRNYNEAWKKLTCKITHPEVRPETIGVLIRSDALGGEQITGVSQTLEQYAEAMQKVATAKTSFLIVSSDEESIAWMEKRFGRIQYVKGVKRCARRSDPEQHVNVPQTVDDAIQVVREVLTLANCSYLIHPVSNMATAALYINLNLKSVYLK